MTPPVSSLPPLAPKTPNPQYPLASIPPVISHPPLAPNPPNPQTHHPDAPSQPSDPPIASIPPVISHPPLAPNPPNPQTYHPGAPSMPSGFPLASIPPVSSRPTLVPKPPSPKIHHPKVPSKPPRSPIASIEPVSSRPPLAPKSPNPQIHHPEVPSKPSQTHHPEVPSKPFPTPHPEAPSEPSKSPSSSPEMIPMVTMLTGAGRRMGLKRSFVESDPDFDGTKSCWRRLSFKWNCDQVRRMIRTLIENGDMKVGEFCAAIGNSQTSYRNFMGVSGKYKGELTDTYKNAHYWFAARETYGPGLPRKKAKKTAKQDGKEKKDGKEFDVSGVQLEKYGELEDAQTVPIFETCDSMRRIINAHLRNTTESQASLARHIKAELGRNIQGAQISSFLGKKGPRAGAESPIFYGGYIYFEKLRIKDGKKKGKFRTEMEERWPGGDENGGEPGLPRKDASRIRLTTFDDEGWKFDKYGHFLIRGPRGDIHC